MSQRSRWLQRCRRGWLRWSTHLSHARPQADARRHRRWAKPCQGTGIWCPQHVHVVFCWQNVANEKLTLKIHDLKNASITGSSWNLKPISVESWKPWRQEYLSWVQLSRKGFEHSTVGLRGGSWWSAEAEPSHGAVWKWRMNPQLMASLNHYHGKLWENSDKPLE